MSKKQYSDKQDLDNSTKGTDSDQPYILFSGSFPSKSSKVVDTEYLRKAAPKIVDSIHLEDGLDPEVSDDSENHEPEQEPETPFHSKLLTFLAKLVMVLVYYITVASNWWTAAIMIQDQFYWYFSLLAAPLLLFWAINIKFNLRDFVNPYKAFFLGLFQVDYIYFQFFLKETDLDARQKFLNETSNNPLKSREFYQILLTTFPILFIMVHIMFVVQYTALIIQASIILTIVSGCVFLMYVVISYDPAFQKIKFNQTHLLLGVGVHTSLEMAALTFLWGYFCALTSPWGAWVFFPISIALWFVICRVLEGKSKFSIAYLLYTSFTPVASTYKVGFYLRIAQFIGMVLVYIICNEELRNILQSGTVWIAYFASGWACWLVWLLISLYFYPSMKKIKDNEPIFRSSLFQASLLRISGGGSLLKSRQSSS